MKLKAVLGGLLALTVGIGWFALNIWALIYIICTDGHIFMAFCIGLGLFVGIVIASTGYEILSEQLKLWRNKRRYRAQKRKPPPEGYYQVRQITDSLGVRYEVWQWTWHDQFGKFKYRCFIGKSERLTHSEALAALTQHRQYLQELAERQPMHSEIVATIDQEKA